MRWMPQSLRRSRMKSATSSAMAESFRTLPRRCSRPPEREPSDYDLPRGAKLETQDVGAVVMPGRVEALTFGVEACGIELRVEDAFLVVERPREVRAPGREDRASAAADDVHPVEQPVEREVIGIAARALEVRGRDHERARLPWDVDERRLPRVAVVGRGSDVELDARFIERKPGERHVVLPADQPAEAPERRLDCSEPTAVARAPDEPLVVGRHELAVPEGKAAVRRVVEERVVEGARVGG